MCGYLRSHGITVSEIRVGQSLKQIDPLHHGSRSLITYRSINPRVYQADYFGHKVHIDQSEKLVMFGVTHVAAIDGYSGRIVGFVSMPIKSNEIIYDKLYR